MPQRRETAVRSLSRRSFLRAAGAGGAAVAALGRQLAARLEELRRESGDRYVYEPTVLVKSETVAGECGDQ